MNHDKTTFPDPDEFIPERFINSTGKFEVPSDKIALPFSIGRRMCPGAEFAKMMMFMFTVTMVQRYKLCRPTTEKLPLHSHMGLGHEVSPFKMVISFRQ